MEEWNGASLLQEFGQRQVSHECWTDASGSVGCGAIRGVEWLRVPTVGKVVRELHAVALSTDAEVSRVNYSCAGTVMNVGHQKLDIHKGRER